ncbi:MAG: carboxypeptidase regulatory-like domain-containing protein [Bryobacteraceae bacterium]
MPLPRRIAVLVLVAVLSGFLGTGQVSPSTSQAVSGERPKTFTIGGTVTNAATGEPIRRALVHVNGPLPVAAFTGPDGRFQVSGIPQGQAFLTAEKPGFFDEQALHPGSYAPQNAAVNVGPGTNDFHLQLTPEAKIWGRVLDPDGEPVEGLQLQLVTWDISEGRKQLQPGMMASTDETGNYRIEGLTPGHYFLRTMVHPVVSAFGAMPRDAYPPQYYPNSPDLASAQPVGLKPGQEAEADFTVHPTATSTITGIVAGPVQNGVSISYQGADGQETPGMYFRLDPRTGKFALGMVPSGSWTLHFTLNDAKGNAYYAEQRVEVNGSDISGLQVVLQPAPAIPVLVNRTANAASASQNGSARSADQGPGVQVQLLSANNASNERFYAAPRPGDSPGALFLQGVRPGTYKVLAQASGAECVESVSAGNIDLRHENLVISPGSQPESITISLRDDCATITGLIRSENQNVSAFIILIGDSAPADPKLFPAQANQNFVFPGLSPGTYRVWAFSNIAGLEYANAEALRDYPGQQMNLGANQKASVNLDLISRRSD